VHADAFWTKGMDTGQPLIPKSSIFVLTSLTKACCHHNIHLKISFSDFYITFTLYCSLSKFCNGYFSL